MRTTYITAILIALAIGAWLFSGQLGKEEPVRPRHPGGAEPPVPAPASRMRNPTRVRARVINASPQLQHVVLRGKTENKRTVSVKAETSRGGSSTVQWNAAPPWRKAICSARYPWKTATLRLPVQGSPEPGQNRI